jgi:hypothetical protein
MMDKVKLVLGSAEYKDVIFKKLEFKVMPFISLATKTEMLNDYIGTLFKEGDPKDNYIQAEYTLILEVVDKLSNIEVIDLENKVLSVDDIISSGLWDFLQSKIEGYDQFRWELDAIIELKHKQNAIENSVGKIVSNLSNKLMVFLDKLNDIDLSDEGINKLVTELKTGLNDLDAKWGPTKPTTSRKLKGTGKNTQPL